MSRYDDIKKRIKGDTTSTQETDIHNNSGYDAVKERIGRFGTGYTTVNNDYINKFASDVDAFNTDIGNSFNNISYSNRNSIRDEYADRYKDINSRANYLRAYANSKGSESNGYKDLVNYLDSIENAYGQYRNAFDSADRYYSQWKTEDDYNSWREANKQTLNATEAEDYAEYSKKGADIKNPSVWKADSGINIFGWKPFREDVNNKVTYTRENYPNAVGGAKDSGMNASYNQMTDDEVGAYNYYLAKEREGLVEKGTADEYLNSIMPYLEARSGVEFANRSGIDEDSNMALKIAFELTNSAVGNVTDAGNLLRAVTDKDYVPQNVFNEASAYVLQTESDSKFKSGVLKLSNIVGAMIPSILVSKGVGNAIAPVTGVDKAKKVAEIAGVTEMGMAAATQEYGERIKAGDSHELALAKGLVHGAWEGASEYFLGSIEGLANNKLLGLLDKKVAGKIQNAIVKTLVKGSLDIVDEGLEEVIQNYGGDIINAVFSGDILDGKIDWTSGEEQWENFLYGMLSALVLNGVNAGTGTVREYYDAVKIKSDEGRFNALKNVGLSMSADSVAGKIAGQIDENSSAWKISRLLHNVNAELTEQNQGEISQYLQDNGFRQKDADSIAEWLEVAVSDTNNILTRKQIKVLDSNPVIASAFNKFIDSNSTVNQRLSGFKKYTENRNVVYGYDMSADANEIGRNLNATYNATQELGLTYDDVTSDTSESKAKVNDAISARLFRNNAINGMERVETRSTDAYLNEQVSDFKAKYSDKIAESNGIKTVESVSNKVSDNNSTTLVSTGEDVKIKKVSSNENGNMKLELADGSIVDSSDVLYRSKDDAVVYETLASMGVPSDVANSVITGWNNSGMSGVNFMLGVDEAYKYGKVGLDIAQELQNSSFASEIPEAVRNIVYRQGVDDAKAEINRKNSGRKKSDTRRKGAVHAPASFKTMTERQKQSIRTIARVASDITNNDVYIYESVLDENGNRVLKEDLPSRKAGQLAPHGVYDPKTGAIYIDLNAGNNGEGVMLYTFAHELTHFVRDWSPAKFKALADFVIAEYGKKGVSVSELIKQKMSARGIGFDEAYEEVIADSMQPMFTDANLGEKLAKLKSQDAGLFAKIKEFFTMMYNKIKALYKGLDPYTDEGKYVKEMKNALDKISDMFAEAVVDAGNTFEVSENNSDGNEKYSFSSIGYTFFGDENISSEDFEKGNYKEQKGYKDYVNNCLSVFMQTHKGVTKKDALAEIVDSIDGIVRVAVASKKAGYDILDDSGKRDIKDSKGRLLFSSLEPNSDYFTSHDISTICDKRKNFAQIYDDIIKRETELGVPAEKSFFNNVDNYFYIHKVLADKGLTQPCRQCYVESMRKNLMPMAKAFLQLINEKDANNKKNPQLYQPSGKNKGSLKETNAKLRERFLAELDNYGMSLSDITAETLTTADGLAELKITAPLLYEAFNSFYGQSKPKMPKSATPFRFGELTALLTDNNGNIRNSVVDKINSTGGFRLQSYSDYQIVNYVDVLQVLFEAGTLGLNGHAYTKVPAFLDATEGTNLKRNISIFMYQDGSEWKLDRNDSFPAPTIEDIYSIVNADKSGNTSIIAVSQNAEMSAYIMANDNIGYGIPFHKSGLKMDTVRQTIVKEGGREIKGYSKIKDHTKQQTEVWASSNADHKAFTKVKNGINIYGKEVNWDFENKKGLTKNELIKKNLMSYIDACYDNGYLPKFREYLMNNEAVLNNVLMYAKELGDVSADATVDDISFKYRGFTIPYGYYKFLGDFGMFTPDGKASPHDTLSLKNYDFDKAVELFGNSEQLRRNEILQQFSNGEERQKYRNSSLTAEELNDIVQQKRSEVVDEIAGRNAKLSDRDIEILDAKYELNPEVKYSERVTDKKLINFLENQEHITTYKAMLLVDGKLYPPMASKVKNESGKYVMSNPRVVGEWMKATEDASNIKSFNADGVGYYELKKENGGTVQAAYNPYEHSSNLVLNDQFESAYNRPNIVTVKCEIPVSEMTSGYKAEHAKDSVGYLDWHSGVVAGQIKGNKRKVYLSRYLKVVEIMDDSEVARLYKETLGDGGIAVPFNVVTPSLRSELEKIGVKIDYNGTPMYQSLQNRKANSNGAKFSIREEAKKEIQDVLDMKQRRADVKLTDSSPTILLNQKGVKNYPLVMKPSHIRENILTEDEARQKGLKTDGTVNYHGLGITKFVDVINGLDDVDEAYRGTKNASNPQRREKYFLLISKETDGVNRINVPVFINETTREAEIYTISNKIATVFGRNNLDDYLKREIRNGNLVRIKKKSLMSVNGTAPIAGDYNNNDLSDSKLSQNESDVNSKFSDRDSEGNTLTKAQQEYFKDSKVRDSEGNLLVMYHGTGADFTEFDRNFIGKTGAFEGAGFNFTPSEGRASSYGGRVMSGYINVTRPLSSDSVTMNARELAKLIEKLDPTGDDIIEKYARDTRDYGTPSFVKREALTTARAVLQYADNDVDVYSELSAGSGGNVSLIEGFEELGYDGVIHYNDDGSIKTVITFNSNQFKNVDNTTPTTNTDIRFSDRVLMGSVFSGGGTLEAGLVYQMLDKEFAVEYNKKIASVYMDNHGKDHMFVGDIRDFDSKSKDSVFYLHASPVCKNYSAASHKSGEKTIDITTAEATARVLEEQNPEAFTVENVKRYIGSEAYNIITKKLDELGYKWDVDVYKASDYGNATNRERMVIRAVKSGELPAKPAKVTQKTSWYEATKDLFDTELIPSTLVKSKIDAIKNTKGISLSEILKSKTPVLIYDTTKSKHITYAFADELAPTLTTKCGDARIVWNGKVYAPTPKFMGRLQGLPDNYKYPKANSTAFKIIGNGIPVQLTKAVMGGLIDSAYEQTHNGEVLFSERDTESFDNRTLLANAMESVAKNDIEKKYIENYKSKIDAINEEERKLSELRAEIKELSFSKGKRDTERIKSLQDEATKSANRINTYDKQLLKLEASAPLKSVLEREKASAIKKAEAKAKQALSDYKESAMKKQEEIISRYQEARRKGIDQRQSTKLRNAVKKYIEDFRQRIQHPTDRRYIPSNLVSGIIDVYDMIDPTGANQESLAAQKYRTVKEALADLKLQYDSLAQNVDYDFSSEFDAEFSKRIAELANSVGNVPLRDMSRSQLEDVYEIIHDISVMIHQATKMIGTDEAITNYEAGQEVIENMQAVKRLGLTQNKVETFFREWTLNPMRAVREMAGFDDNSMLVKLFKGLNEGRRKADKFKMDVTKKFDAMRSSKEGRKAFNDAVEKATITVYDTEGKEVKISKMQAMQAILTYEREQANDNRNHLSSPVRFTNVADDVKGKYSNAFDNGHNVYVDENFVQRCRKEFSEWDNSYIDLARRFFNEDSKNAINEVSLLTKHRLTATEKAYIPYKVNSDYISKESDNVKYDASIGGAGILKSVKNNAPQQLVIRGLNALIDEHIDDVAKIYGLTVPVRNFNKVFNMKQTKDDGGIPVKSAIRDTWQDGGLKLLDQAVADIQSNRRTESSKALSSVKSAFVTSTLASNVSVWMKQAASYPTAGSILSASSLAQALPNFARNLDNVYEEIDKYTSQHWIRRQGLSSQELGEMNQSHGWQNRLNDKLGVLSPMNWIQAMDVKTTAVLWIACKNEVQSMGIKPSDAEYFDKVTELYDKVIEDTQPMYDSLHRAEITKNSAWKNIIMFQTQPIQNSGILREGAMEYKMAKKQYGKNSKQAKKAFKKFRMAVGSQMASHLTFTAMTLLAAAILHKMNPYRDDDKELTTESVLNEFGKQFTKNFFGAIVPVFGTYATSIIEKFEGGNRYDVVSDPTVDKINSTIDTFSKLSKPSLSAFKDVLVDVSTYFGIPAKNAENIINGVKMHIQDISGSGFLSFEAGVERTGKQDYGRVYESIMDNDTEEIARLKKKYGDKYSSEVRKALADNDSRIAEAAKARIDGDVSTYTSIARSIIADGFTQDDVVSAINTVINSLKKGETPTPTSAPKSKSLYDINDFATAIETNNRSMMEEIRNDMIEISVANGKTRESAEESFATSAYNAIKDGYELGQISDTQAVDALVKYGGKSEDYANSKVRFWRFQEEYPEYNITEEQLNKYYNPVEGLGYSINESGISVETYADYVVRRKNCTGTDEDGDGKTDSGSVKAEVLKLIDRLPISNYQKDALYYLNGWSSKTIDDAGWH